MLKLREERTSLTTLLILVTLAYLFSVSLRFIWVNEFNAQPQVHWNNELMISNNDGYYYAEGARDILQGHHEKNDLSPIDTAMSQLTAVLAKILPISFETLILYMPSFLGSLIVIPLILIGRALNQTTMGFIAALIGSIANSYYNRTMSGYYDTDMLNIVFPVLEMYSLILALTHQRNRYLIPITISIALYQWWYPQAYALDTALLLMILGYTIIFDRKNIYFYKIALFILIGILAVPIVAKIGLAVLIFALFHFKKELSIKLFWPLFAVIIGIYFFTGGIDPIWFHIKIYFFTNGSENTIASSLHYYNVMSTVREAGQIPFTVFAERISGHTITFILACIGYGMALIAYRPLLVTLPLVGLGFIAMFAGLRFTIYAVPMMAIGFAYLLLWTTQRIKKSWLRYLSLFIFTLAALYPNYTHIREYMTPTVFIDQEVLVLDELRKIAAREDYVISWWDYGYPIRYYADVKTWVDGGKHSGDVNFPTAFVLTAQDSASAAHMMRLYTEYTEQGFNDKNKTANDFEYMLSKEGFRDPNDFINALSLPEYKTPQKSRDAFLFLPLRMLDIFPTVSLFSNLDLNGTEKKPSHFFFVSHGGQDTGASIELGQGVSIIKATSTLKMGAQSMPIKAFYQVGYDPNKKLQINRQNFASDGLTVIYMASYGQFLVMDDYFFNSTYIQMFVLEQYDRNLFQPVILSPMAKIYKLKI
ncbi:MAG: peptide transporter [Sulfuricurvum sp.]|uniref:STT3 domain-containing protein n=1 Tax=Sulfuricurvum sp. TaxID=2025608 RepID=UPI0025F9EDFD|nr:STT3 domain-containing protein [Sulfuricurvum sp.]MBV5321117.1 peptide transporter [Sulfuricurvum sp.]